MIFDLFQLEVPKDDLEGAEQLRLAIDRLVLLFISKFLSIFIVFNFSSCEDERSGRLTEFSYKFLVNQYNL